MISDFGNVLHNPVKIEVSSSASLSDGFRFQVSGFGFRVSEKIQILNRAEGELGEANTQ
jgi:hypothetical protein